MSSTDNYTLKIVLLGNSGVGKTTIVNKWITGAHNKTITPTVGANHQKKTIEIDKQTIELFIWDTAGQEQFQALTPLYARSAACAIICASIVDAQSFKSLDKWRNLVADSCEKLPPIILCVNKIDLSSDITVSHDEIEDNFGQNFNNIFYVSAYTGEGIDELFTHSGKLGLEYTRSCEPSTSETKLNDKKDKKGCC